MWRACHLFLVPEMWQSALCSAASAQGDGEHEASPFSHSGGHGVLVHIQGTPSSPGVREAWRGALVPWGGFPERALPLQTLKAACKGDLLGAERICAEEACLSHGRPHRRALMASPAFPLLLSEPACGARQDFLCAGCGPGLAPELSAAPRVCFRSPRSRSRSRQRALGQAWTQTCGSLFWGHTPCSTPRAGQAAPAAG